MIYLQTNEFYVFLEFRLDTQNRLLTREGRIVSLTVKEFEVLLILIENAGTVVSKDVLLERIWKDTFVEEGTLTRNISYLRKKLDSEKNGTQYIETLPKRGYRFLPEVVKEKILCEPNADENLEQTAPKIDFPIDEPTTAKIRFEDQLNIAATGETIYGEKSGYDSNQFHSRPQTIAEAKTKRGNLLWTLGILAVFLMIALAVYFNFYRQTAPRVVMASHFAPFSGLPGREDMPSFSPDGKQVVFVWNGGVSKTTDIYVKMLGEGEPVRLTYKNHDALYPAFSPDGKRIAYFISFPDRTEIYTISALGGAERKIAEVNSGGTSFSWSPDGKSIAVADRISEDSAKSGTAVFLIDVESGEKQKLTSPPENLRDFSPRFSPDGKSLVFIRGGENNEQDLFTQNLTSAAVPRRLTFDRAQISSLAWSADGKNIIYSSKRNLSVPNLWQVYIGGGEPQLIATNAKNPTNLSVSPDGKSIAFVESVSEFSIWRFDLNESAKQPIVPKLIPYIRRDHSPQISPGGSQIVFWSNRTGENELWLADAEGKNQRQLTEMHGAAGSPRFSPDGKSIAYDGKISGKGDIFIYPVEGGEPRNLTTNPAHDVLPSWSADGRWIYFCSDRNGEYQIWKIPAAGGEAVQITKRGGIESIPAPDGKTLYYLRENGAGGLMRTTVDGGAEVIVPELAAISRWRSWTVANKGIYFVAGSENSPYQIKFYDFATLKVTEIAAVEKKPVSISPALSATFDGNTILFSEQEQNAGSIIIAGLPD